MGIGRWCPDLRRAPHACGSVGCGLCQCCVVAPAHCGLSSRRALRSACGHFFLPTSPGRAAGLVLPLPACPRRWRDGGSRDWPQGRRRHRVLNLLQPRREGVGVSAHPPTRPTRVRACVRHVCWGCLGFCVCTAGSGCMPGNRPPYIIAPRDNVGSCILLCLCV